MKQDEMLKQQAYLAVEEKGESVRKDPYYPGYHLAPPVGLLNDPNGWIQWKGIYHLFFQWMPFHAGHGAKFWGHYTSEDLVHWNLEPIALTPSDWFDKNGCYSGSAVDADRKLKLFYTGNVKDEHNQRESYQVLAESEDGITFTKKGVKIELPEGYTPHFRDPKVWEHNGRWYMVIGAQTEDNWGSVVLFESVDLEKWTHKGILSRGNEKPFTNLGYMWECPDLFELGGKDVLVFSPQGLEADGIDFNNQYQTGYVVGELDYKEARYTHGDFTELDRGFEFYAPQSALDDQGRRIVVGWMGVPDQDEELQPTVKNGWVHQMTMPRELKLMDGKIYQLPLNEMKELRSIHRNNTTIEEEISTEIERTSEIKLDGEIESIVLFDYSRLIYDRKRMILTLERPSYRNGEIEQRSCILKNDLEHLHLFVDHSSLEIFVNNGEEVFTSRLFADPSNNSLKIKPINSAGLQVWDLKNDTIKQENYKR